MYSVKLDDNKYFTGSFASIGEVSGGSNVDSLPPSDDPKKSLFYKYDYHDVIIDNVATSVLGWFFDEQKYNAWLEEQENTIPEPTLEEKIITLETENKNLKTDIKSTKEVLQMILFGEI